jgi:hypothetical protein
MPYPYWHQPPVPGMQSFPDARPKDQVMALNAHTWDVVCLMLRRQHHYYASTSAGTAKARRPRTPTIVATPAGAISKLSSK